MALEILPISIRQAKAFVSVVHRHLPAPQGAVFALGVWDSKTLVGVALVARPVSRYLDDGWTAEVTRVATNGAKNACSLLYGAAWRVCRQLGYCRVITYTLEMEPGTSLRAAGWIKEGPAGGGEWSRKVRPRKASVQVGNKVRWSVGKKNNTPHPCRIHDR